MLVTLPRLIFIVRRHTVVAFASFASKHPSYEMRPAPQTAPIMSNASGNSPEPHRHAVNNLFARIASRYDLINDLQSFGLHRLWKRRVVALAGLRPGMRALDLCCGTGDIALAMARKGADVVGLDFNDWMLDLARRKPPQLSGKSGIQAPPVFWMRSDALQLPFRSGSFDVVTAGYALRNLADWEAGLTEIHRVVRPAGRLLILDFGKPDNALWRAVYFGYLRLFVPLLGRILCGDARAYAYILESLKRYPAQRGVAAKMAALGMANLRVINLFGGAMSINCGDRAGTGPNLVTLPER